MLAAYGVDVLDPGVSTRRVWVLLERLPPAVRRLGEQWSTEAELLAGLIDEVAYNTWVLARVYGSRSSAPKPVPRPPQRRREPEPARGAWDDVVRQLAAIPGVRVTRT
jgi:hypothetical protein